MRHIILTALITCLAVGTAAAQSCDSKAVSANGKPLHGAAKMSFVKKCKRDACGSQAVGANGKPASRCGKEQLHGEVHEDGLERSGVVSRRYCSITAFPWEPSYAKKPWSPIAQFLIPKNSPPTRNLHFPQ
jgi:hypothetical protein